jgi:hypothetical protein
MKKRLDSVLRYSIYSYVIICFAGLMTDEIKIINTLTLKKYWQSSGDAISGYAGSGYTDIGFEAISILALLIVVRYVVFGKTYQK